jgi:hypothetical protein
MKKIIIASLLLVSSIAIAQSMRSRSGYVDGSHLEVAISKENLADSQWDEKVPLPVSIKTAIKIARERVKRDYPNVEWTFLEAALVKRTINKQSGYFYQIQFKEAVSEEDIPKRVEEGRSRMQDVKISILLNSTVIQNKKKDS